MIHLVDTQTGLVSGSAVTLKFRAMPTGKAVRLLLLKFVGTMTRGVGALADYSYEQFAEIVRSIRMTQGDISILFQNGNEVLFDYFQRFRQRIGSQVEDDATDFTLYLPILLERPMGNKADRKLTRPLSDYLENANLEFNLLETMFDPTDIADINCQVELYCHMEDAPAGYSHPGGIFIKNNTNFAGSTLPINESHVISDRLIFSGRTENLLPPYSSFSLHSDDRHVYNSLESRDMDMIYAEHDQEKEIEEETLYLGSPGMEAWPVVAPGQEGPSTKPFTLIAERRNQKDLGRTLNVHLNDRDNDQDVSWYYSGWRRQP